MKDFEERLQTYDKDHCWQYDIRLNNLEEDLKLLPCGVDYKNFTVDDFEFKPLCTAFEKECANSFIKRHEWLGSIAMFTDYYFGAYYNDILSGVITFGVPNAFSKVIGDGTKDVECLISRGACISWSPKGLASKFMMWCLRWMVKNTKYRVFTAYSDPRAKELGTIYQACNFYYIGNRFGTTTRYISPYTGNIVSDRCFRMRSFYKHYAEELGIPWGDTWIKGTNMCWDNVPPDIAKRLKDYGKEKMKEAKKVVFPPKHKYVYVLGASKLETKRLRKKFEEHTKYYDYPKERGV